MIPITKPPCWWLNPIIIYYPIPHAAVPHVFRTFCRARKLPNSCRTNAKNWCHRRRRRLRSLRSWEARGQNRAPWSHPQNMHTCTVDIVYSFRLCYCVRIWYVCRQHSGCNQGKCSKSQQAYIPKQQSAYWVLWMQRERDGRNIIKFGYSTVRHGQLPICCEWWWFASYNISNEWINGEC